MDLEVLPTEELDESRRGDVVALCIAAHEVQEFENLFTVFIQSGGRHVLCHADGLLVSHAVATTRWAQPEGHPILRTAYVDAVSTLPEAQGRGYGSATMRRLVDELDDFEIGCLQTDRIGFYDRLGWELWRGPLAGRGEDGLIPTPDQRGVMIMRLRQTPPGLDLDGLLTIEPQPSRIWE